MLPDLPFPIVDAHTHLMPERLFQAVRAYFRAHLWHMQYEGTTEQLVDRLLEAGIDRFVFSAYAHRSGMAESLNYWAANVESTFAPYALGYATFHPDDAVAVPRLVAEAFGRLGLHGVKLHPQVGRFSMDDTRLFPLYERAVELRKPILIHAGRQPEPNEYVGARAFRRLLRRFPDLLVVVAHMGADEFDAFFDLCGEYEGLHLDTAMVFNQHLNGPPRIERILEFQDRVLFGSDFPNIPYRLESAIDAIRDLRLGRAIEQKLLCTNAARILGLDPAEITATSTPSPAGDGWGEGSSSPSRLAPDR